MQIVIEKENRERGRKNVPIGDEFKAPSTSLALETHIDSTGQLSRPTVHGHVTYAIQAFKPRTAALSRAVLIYGPNRTSPLPRTLGTQKLCLPVSIWSRVRGLRGRVGRVTVDIENSIKILIYLYIYVYSKLLRVFLDSFRFELAQTTRRMRNVYQK